MLSKMADYQINASVFNKKPGFVLFINTNEFFFLSVSQQLGKYVSVTYLFIFK